MTLETGPETLRGLLQAEIFSGAPKWDAIAYRGAPHPKILRFEVTHEARTRPFYFAAIISRDEKTAWQSFQDLLGHAVDGAQTGMSGFFGLEVLSADIQNGIRYFNPGDFSRLLVNHSKGDAADFKTLIRYGQLFCLLHKRAPADWGKVELKTHVEIVDPEKTRFELFVRKMLRECGQVPEAIYGIHDMSVNPVWKTWEEPLELGAASAAPEVHLFRSSTKTAHRLIFETC